MLENYPPKDKRVVSSARYVPDTIGDRFVPRVKERIVHYMDREELPEDLAAWKARTKDLCAEYRRRVTVSKVSSVSLDGEAFNYRSLSARRLCARLGCGIPIRHTSGYRDALLPENYFFNKLVVDSYAFSLAPINNTEIGTVMGQVYLNFDQEGMFNWRNLKKGRRSREHVNNLHSDPCPTLLPRNY